MTGRPRVSGPVLAGLILLLVAGFLRLRHLGYSEYQGDEARAMLFAAHLLETGDSELLLWHKKGPAEVVVPAAMLSTGWTSETAARVPFALFGLAVVAAVMAMGWRLWGAAAGLTAGLIVALDGYLVAFSRIVQYQSLVLAASTAAVWLAGNVWWRGERSASHEKAPGSRAPIALALGAGAAVGIGTWAHYEAVFALPPVIWLLSGRPGVAGQPAGWAGLVDRFGLAAAAVSATAIAAALFYVPFALHPQFAATVHYIADSRVGGGVLYNNLTDWFHRATFYNLSYWVLALAAGLVVVVAAGLRDAVGRFGRFVAPIWLVLVAWVALDGGAFALGGVDGPSIAVAVFAPVLALVAFSGRIPVAWRAMLVWFAGPFVAAAFLVTKPHTHFYTMMPGAALLIGWGVARLVPSLVVRGRVARWTAVVAAAALVGFAVLHQVVVFVRHEPEYKRVYPEARLEGVWTPFGDEMPRGGYFGFPYRAGWRAIQHWYGAGALAGSYDSNEEVLITGWYTWGAPRCVIDPRYYIVAWRPQDAEEVPDDLIARGYRTWGVVTVGGREKLRVYARSVDGPVRRVAVEDLPGADVPAPLTVTQALQLPIADVPARTFEDSIRLIGAESRRPAAPNRRAGLDEPGAAPEAAATVVLTWDTVAQPERNLSAFVHLRNAAGQTVAQSDHWPECGSATSTWSVGDLHYDAHALPVPADLVPGVYTVWAGLYDGERGAALTVTAGLPDEVGRDAILVAQIEIP